MSNPTQQNGIANAFHLLNGEVEVETDFIRSNAYLQEGDCAFVAGSLIEGIGNRYSDVDVHVITKRLRLEKDIRWKDHFRVLSPERSILTGNSPEAPVFLIHTVVPGNHIKVDVEYRTYSEISGLMATINSTFQYATSSPLLLTKYLPQRELAFIHRLFNSADIAGESSLLGLRNEIDRRKFEYLMYRWKASDYSVLLDMLGAWEDLDWIRCADLARENAVTQFHAYSHLCGNTNYHRKWILSYARRCDIEQRLVQGFQSILTSGFADEKGGKDFVIRSLDFVDEIFEATNKRLEALEIVPSGALAINLIEDGHREDAGEYSDMEVAYRKKPYGVAGVPTREWFLNV
jgi:hypothetical protein